MTRQCYSSTAPRIKESGLVVASHQNLFRSLAGSKLFRENFAFGILH